MSLKKTALSNFTKTQLKWKGKIFATRIFCKFFLPETVFDARERMKKVRSCDRNNAGKKSDLKFEKFLIGLKFFLGGRHHFIRFVYSDRSLKCLESSLNPKDFQ